MTRHIHAALVALAVIGLIAIAISAKPAQAAQIELYETGPAEDASFLRFVNGTELPMEVSGKNAQARLKLDVAKPASTFLPVRANAEMQGMMEGGSAKTPIAIKVAPGEFATVVGLTDEKSGLRTVVVREQPDDFNALKASIGFYNLDASCQDAGLLAAGRNVAIFEKVGTGAVARRQVNPVALSVQTSCGGQAVGQPLDLGTLPPGARYSVLLLPSKAGPRLVRADDELAN